MMKYPEKYKGKKITHFYSYTDTSGQEVFVVGRTEDKQFPLFHLTGSGRWEFKAPKINVPYRLHELVASNAGDDVFIVEGEKDVETLVKAGFIATTNRSGANATSAFKGYAKYFQGRRVVIIPDNDKPGIKHAETVKEILLPWAESAVLVHLPGAGVKGDVTDWFDAGLGDAKLLKKLVKKQRDSAAAPSPAAAADSFPEDQRGDAWEPAREEIDPEDSFDAAWKAFPLDTLPVEMATFMQEAAALMACDPAFFVLGGIVSMGAAIGNSRIVRLNDEWPEPSVFWGCLVAESTTMKSAASKLATAPASEHDWKMYEAHTRERDQFDEAMKLFRGCIGASGKDQGGAVQPELPNEPTEHLLCVDDITPESLAEKLSVNPKGLLLKQDELAAWFGSFCRYQAAGSISSSMPFWLEAFNAGWKRVDRKGGKRLPIVVKRAAVGVYGNTQDETIGDVFTPTFFKSGFVARILFCMPPSAKKVFVRGGIPAPIKFSYHETFRRLFNIDDDQCFRRDYEPVTVPFSKKGLDAWESFYGEWSDRQYSSFGEHAKALGKLEAYCARFSLLFALVDFVNQRIPYEEIRPEHVERAFRVVKWFADECCRVYVTAKKKGPQLDVERVVNLIRKHQGEMTPRRLLQSNPSRYENTAGATKVLEQLVSAQLVERFVTKPSDKGGRPSTVYRLHA